MRSVLEDMSKMRLATGATDFNSAHTVTFVFMLGYGLFTSRLPEARPATPGIIFRFGLKQDSPATNTLVFALFLAIVKLPGECPLRAAFPRHLVLLISQHFAPFIVSLVELVSHGVISSGVINGHQNILTFNSDRISAQRFRGGFLPWLSGPDTESAAMQRTRNTVMVERAVVQ